MKTINRIIPITLGAAFILITTCSKEQKELPAASFLCPNTVGIGDTIYFQNFSEGANTFDWDFGDGNVSTEKNPSHIYTEPGVFTIILVATNEDGSDEASWDILIKPWGTRAPMPTARFWFTSEVVNGKIYVFGGATANYAPTLATVEEYDPVTDTWTTKQEMPTPRYNMASAVVDGKIYTMGGDSIFILGWGDGLHTLEVYDPSNDTWDTQKTQMPRGRMGASACAVNGIIYVTGGVYMLPGDTEGRILRTVEAYNPATDTWTTKAHMPTGRWALSMPVINGKIYAMGGSAGGEHGLSTVELYDPETNTWTTKASIPVVNCYFGTGIVDGIIYIIGGWDYSAHSRVFAYDPEIDEWSEKAAMPTVRMGLVAGVVNGKIYAIGGTPHYQMQPLSTNEEYSP
jgi:N-acetylneuraminic acid mutarotase